MELKHLSTAKGHEVSGFMISEYTELMHQGMAPVTESMPLNYQHKIIYVTEGDMIIGAMAYQKVDWKNVLYIYFGCVHKNFRLRGVYRMMWTELLLKAEEEKVAGIEGSSFVTNEPMKAVNASFGRRPIAISFRYDMPCTNQGA